MLASILPGLREIRAPLAAGYLWLVVGWLLLHHRVEKGASAPGAVDALTTFRDAIGLGGVAAAATFVAYLLGALWEPISIRAAEGLWSARNQIRRRRLLKKIQREWGHESTSTSIEPSVPSRSEKVARMVAQYDFKAQAYDGLLSGDSPRTRRISGSAWSRLWLIGRRLFADVDENLAVRLGSSVDPHSTERALAAFEPPVDANYWTVIPGPTRVGFDEFVAALDHIKFSSPRDSWWINEAGDFAVRMDTVELYARLNSHAEEKVLALQRRSAPVHVEEIHPSHGEETDRFAALGGPEITSGLFDELPLVARRLVGDEQELFLEASRMKGEVEFRYALAIPIPITVSVATFGLGVPTWVWIAASLAGVAAGWGLLADGWRRDTARNDYLVELLAIGKAKSPTFERLLERARQAGTDHSDEPIDEVGAREPRTENDSQPAGDMPPERPSEARAAR